MRSVSEILQAVAEGERVREDEAVRLFEEADLLDLGSVADRIRESVIPTGSSVTSSTETSTTRTSARNSAASVPSIG